MVSLLFHLGVDMVGLCWLLVSACATRAGRVTTAILTVGEISELQQHLRNVYLLNRF